MTKPQLQRDQKTNTVSFPRSEKLAPEQASLPTVAGYNLSEFSLAPLGLKTKHLAYQKRGFEWVHQLNDGTERTCFFEISYGDPAPNAHTEDVLLILTHLVHQSDNPFFTPASIYEILKIQGVRHTPNKQQIDQVVRHLDALCGTWIRTNFVYDRTDNDWRSVKTGVLSGYTYKDESGKVRKRKVKIKRGEGSEEFAEVIREERVFELKDFSFAPNFLKYFVQDTVDIDLAVYFSLEKPTPKRIFRFGNKYIQTVGHHSLDLHLFCLSRIGMSYDYVTNRRPSNLAGIVRAYANRVTETGTMAVSVERSSTTSGYKITFDKPVKQIPLFSGFATFTKAETKAYDLLRTYGLWDNVARRVVVKYRNMLGKDGARYITFAVRQFQKQLIDTDKLRVPPKKRGGVLAKALENDWYYPDFYEWQAKEEKRQWRDERKKYPGEQPVEPSRPGESSPPYKLAIGAGGIHVFSLERFKQDHAEIHQQIVDAVTPAYDEFSKYGLGQARLEEMRNRAIETYCKQCFDEFVKGNTGYFPPTLLTDQDQVL